MYETQEEVVPEIEGANQEESPEIEGTVIEGAENREKAQQEIEGFENQTEAKLGENDEVEDGKESNNSDKIDQGSDEKEEVDKRPTRRVIIDSDDEDKEDDDEEHDSNGQGSEKEEELDDEGKPKEAGGDVSELMQNIFGEDMSEDDEEKEGEGDLGGPSEKVVHGSDNEEDEPKLLRVERSDDEDDHLLGRRWDFDEMMAKKKLERRRRRRRDGSIDLMADADDQIKALVDAMNEAAAEDRNANIDRRPAIRKRKMLPIVKNTLLKVDLFEAMLDNGMVSAISEWLAPLPDKSLVALEIRCSLLKILERWPNLEQSTLKQSGLGRAVMYLFKHPKETRENKLIASKLIREWSRPIFQLESDFRTLSKEERVQRDYSQMPLAKRKRLSVDDESGIPIFSGANKLHGDDEPKHPGEPGFIPRARVPKPSTKDYVVRPRPEIEGRFRGETKSKQISRLVRTQRQFQQKNSANTLKRATGVSISGKNL